jgi:hypothetical protein
MSNPTTTPLGQNEVHTAVDLGQTLQVAVLPADMGLGTSINASGSSVSNVIFMNGYKAFAFGCTSSQNGTVSIQRYLDAAGTIVQGAALTVSLTGATAAVLNNSDNHPYQSMIITVSNSGGSTATLTSTLLLLQSN